MKKTLHIDERLLKEARAVAQAGSDTETVQRGLEALLRDAAYQRLRALRGSEPGAKEPNRRKETHPSATKARSSATRRRKAA
jgi:hypothetical protein